MYFSEGYTLREISVKRNESLGIRGTIIIVGWELSNGSSRFPTGKISVRTDSGNHFGDIARGEWPSMPNDWMNFTRMPGR
jgi:hypothetical protein